jgi:cell division septal protein FtsQ
MTDGPVKENVRPAQNRRHGILLLVFLMVAYLVVFIMSFEWKDTLKIERVVVEGARILPAKQIVGRTEIYAQSPLYETDIYAVRSHLESDPMIKAVLVSRELPGTLSIAVCEREPIAALSNDQILYVDAEGVLLPHVETTVQFDLPFISGIDSLSGSRIGRPMNQPDIYQAIEVLKTAQSLGIYHSISELNMNHGGDIVLNSTDGGVPVVLGRGSFPKKLEMLRSFWNNFVNMGNVDQMRYVDLRFEDQVVVKWNQQAEPSTAKAAL